MTDEEYMGLAIAEAEKATEHDDVPIGAVVVHAGEVLGAARNERELRADPTAHAEILALRAAAETVGTWRLEGATLYVTLEPCAMCAGALVLARVQRLVYGATDTRAGAAYSLYNIPQDPRLNHTVEITTDVLVSQCEALLKGFFGGLR